MNTKNWGNINCPFDSDAIQQVLKIFENRLNLKVCELGVWNGHTGNRIVDYLKLIGVKKIEYFGIDNLDLNIANDVANPEPVFEHDEMKFICGDRKAIQKLPQMDFGLIDACHCAECVFHDGIAVSKKIKKNGLMLFHDTCQNWQYPSKFSFSKDHWQHYSNKVPIRPLNVNEGIIMGRAMWHGEWELISQTGDELYWGGIRVYQKKGK